MNIPIDDIEKKYLEKKDEFTAWLNRLPGFTIPFQTSNDFFDALALPFITLVSSSVICAIATLATGLSSLICAGSLLVGAFSGLVGLKKVSQPSFDLTVLTALITGISLLTATVSALTIVLGTMHAIGRLVTRTGATLFSPLFNFFTANKEEPAPMVVKENLKIAQL
jgi:hypothetical protein